MVGRAFTTLTYTEVEKAYRENDRVEKMCNPAHVNIVNPKFPASACRHLDENGLPEIGTTITSGMILIGKIQIVAVSNDDGTHLKEEVRDMSVIWKKPIAQRVKQVVFTVSIFFLNLQKLSTQLNIMNLGE